MSCRKSEEKSDEKPRVIEPVTATGQRMREPGEDDDPYVARDGTGPDPGDLDADRAWHEANADAQPAAPPEAAPPSYVDIVRQEIATLRAGAPDLDLAGGYATIGEFLGYARKEAQAQARADAPRLALEQVERALALAGAGVDPRTSLAAIEAAQTALQTARIVAGLDSELVLGAVPVDGLDIFAELPPTPWLCRGLQWAPGRPNQIQGYGGAGKTMVAIAAAVAMVASVPIWGCSSLLPAERPLRGIHLDYDQGRNATLRRYQRIARGMGIEPSTIADGLRVVSRPPIRLTSFADPKSVSGIDREGAINAYCDVVKGYDFAIVDALRGLVAGIDENDSRIRDFLDILGDVSEQTGCTIIFLHHTGKGGTGKGGAARPDAEQGRGSSAIQDGSGSVLLVAADPDHAGIVSIKMTRDSADRDGGARMEDSYLAIVDVPIDGNDTAGLRVDYRTQEAVEGEAPSKIDTRDRDRMKAILVAVKANPGATVKALRGMTLGGSAAKIGDAIAALQTPGFGSVLKNRPEPGERGQRLFVADGLDVDAWEPPGVAARKAAKGTVPCPKCGGAGKLPEFRTVNDGRCAPCGGSGQVTPAFAEKIAADLESRQHDRRADD